MRATVVGGGIFGVTTALALRARGIDVTLVEPELTNPLAESTDVSKVIRIEYGSDEDYTALGEQALAGWRRWNAEWPRPLFHETGVTFLSRAPMQPGGFEHDSFELLRRRGHPLERVDAAAITARFPAYLPGAFVDGYVNPVGGWAEATHVVSALATRAQRDGVVLRSERIDRVDAIDADLVIVCAGSWTPLLVPELAPHLRAVGQPVFHLRPDEPSLFEATRFPVFGADISRTGYYGFPLHPSGIVKIANHGVGSLRAADAPRGDVTADEIEALRAMLRATFPTLADAPIVGSRICVYSDTVDGNFWIAPHPTSPNVCVATGGSGHAFKFAPVLGDLIATIALGAPHPLAAKFRWRAEPALAPAAEAARHAPVREIPT